MNNVSNQGKGNVPKGVQNAMKQYLKIQELYNNYQKTKNNINLEKTLSLLKKVEEVKNMFIFLTPNNRKSIINIRKSLEKKLENNMFLRRISPIYEYNNENNYLENVTSNNYIFPRPGDFIMVGSKLLYVNNEFKDKKAHSNYNTNITINQGYSQFTRSIEYKLQNILSIIYKDPESISNGRISVRRDDELIIREFGTALPSKYKYFLEPHTENFLSTKINNPLPFMFTVRRLNNFNNNSIVSRVPMFLKKSNNIYSFTLKNKNNKSKLLNHLKNN